MYLAKKHGVTLIELIVTIAIIAVLVITALPAYNSSRRSQELNVAALSVVDVVEKTRQYSIAPRSDAPRDVAGYCYKFTEGESPTWVIGELYDLGSSIECGSANVIENGDVANYIWLNCEECSVAFTAGGDAIAGTPVIDNQEIYRVEHSKTGDYKNIILEVNGVVNVD